MVEKQDCQETTKSMRDLGVNSSHYLIHLEPYNRIHPFDKFALTLISLEEGRYYIYVLPQGEREKEYSIINFTQRS